MLDPRAAPLTPPRETAIEPVLQDRRAQRNGRSLGLEFEPCTPCEVWTQQSCVINARHPTRPVVHVGERRENLFEGPAHDDGVSKQRKTEPRTVTHRLGHSNTRASKVGRLVGPSSWAPPWSSASVYLRGDESSMVTKRFRAVSRLCLGDPGELYTPRDLWARTRARTQSRRSAAGGDVRAVNPTCTKTPPIQVVTLASKSSSPRLLQRPWGCGPSLYKTTGRTSFPPLSAVSLTSCSMVSKSPPPVPGACCLPDPISSTPCA